MKALTFFLLFLFAVIVVLVVAAYNPPPRTTPIEKVFNLSVPTQNQTETPSIPREELLELTDRIVRVALAVTLLGISLSLIAGLVVR